MTATKEKKTREQIEKILNRDILANILEDVHKGKVKESEVKHILTEIVNGKNYGEFVGVKGEDLENIEEKIIKIIKSKPGLGINGYMGLVMKEFKGKISGSEASEIIRKYMKK